MALSLVGLEPGKVREYVWIGDDAVDREKSDLAAWLRDGSGLVYLDGGKPTVFRCEPLRPTTLQIVYAHGRMGMQIAPGPNVVDQLAIAHRNVPAVFRAAVSYSVVSADGLDLQRVADAGGSRLADATLDMLDRLEAEMAGVMVRFMEHLGALVMRDATPTELEKKVS